MMSEESNQKAENTEPESINLSDGEALLARLLASMQSTSADSYLERIIDLVLSITGASRGIILIVDDAGTAIVHASKNADTKFLNSSHAGRVFGSLTGVFKQSSDILMTSNVQQDPKYKPSDSIFGLTLRSIMAIPMLKDSKLIGIVYIEQELRKGTFERLGLNLSALQNLVSIATLHYLGIKGNN